MNVTRCVLLIVALSASGPWLGCMSYPVETDYDPVVDFGSLKTYAWLETEREKTGDPRVDNDLLDGRIRRAVDAALFAKGYERTAAGLADFDVTYHTAIERKIDVRTHLDSYPSSHRWRTSPGYAYTTVREYDVGSLILDIIEPREKQLIWRGSRQARIGDDGTPEQRETRARTAVEAILAEFPPQ